MPRLDFPSIPRRLRGLADARRRLDPNPAVLLVPRSGLVSMRILANQRELRTAASWIAGTCPGRPRVPLHAGILITATKDGYILQATDGDIFATAAPAGAVLQDGTVLVPGRLFAEMITTAPAGSELTLTLADDDRLVITSPRGRWRLPCLPLELYPRQPAVDRVLGEVHVDSLDRAVAAALPACSDGPVMLDLEDAHVVGTDGRRVALCQFDWQPAADRAGTDPAYCLTGAALSYGLELGQASGASKITLAEAGGGLLLMVGGWSALLSVRADPEYDWRDLATKSHELAHSERVDYAIVNTAELNAALAAVRLVLQDDLTVAVMVDSERITLDAANQTDRGDGAHSAAVRSYSGQPRTVGLGPNYLRAALAGVKTESVAVGFGASTRDPVCVRPVDNAGLLLSGYLHCMGHRRLPPSFS